MATVTENPEIPADPPRMRLYLPNAKKMVEGLESIGPGKEVSLRIKGTVQSFDNMDYMEGADITVRPTAVKVVTDDQEISLDDAISAAEETV